MEHPGNTNSLSPDNCRAPFMISTARGESGTRCSRRVFVRAAGIVHVPLVKSTSDQRAPSTSPVRAAVKMRNSKASFAISPISLSRKVLHEGRYVGVRHGGMVRVTTILVRQDSREAVHRVVAGAMAGTLRPVEDEANAP